MTRLPVLAALVAVLALAGSALAVDPHPIGGGLWECPRGWQVRQGPRCVPEQRGVAVEISPLPSAGEGSRQPTSPSYYYQPTYAPPRETTVHVELQRHGCESSGGRRVCW